jgi:ribosomal protein S18 acetylase RimI-like enzyme
LSIIDFTADQAAPLSALFDRLPASDLTFIKDETRDPAVVAGWVDRKGWCWVAQDGGTVTGFAALLPLSGWSDHVAELRLVVDPATRGQGLGRELTLHAVTAGLREGIRKIVVEVAADQEGPMGLFSRLGFSGEALLRDHFRDRTGELRDLVMLAFFTDTTFDAMDAIGVTEALTGGN